MIKHYKLFLSLFLWSMTVMSQTTIDQLPASNCTPFYSNKANNYIGEVKIDDSFTNTSSSSSYTNYSDDASLQYSIQAGQNFNLSVLNCKYYNNQDVVAVYIDYNRDGLLTEPELTILTKDEEHWTTADDIKIARYKSTITLPEDAQAGLALMRIICHSDGANLIDPCRNGTYGEVEDYAINIQPSGIYPMFTNNANMLMLNEEVVFTDNSMGEGITSYLWDFGEGATPATANGIGPYKVAYNSLGSKTVKLTISNGEDTKASQIEHAVTVSASNPELAKPKGFVAKVDHNTIALEWLNPNESYFSNPEGFEGNVFPPRGWGHKRSVDINSKKLDVDGGKIRWEWNTHENNRHSGAYGVRITSNRPEFNWLISPSIKIYEQQQLSFWLKLRNRDKFNCQLLVMVKEEGTDWVNLLIKNDKTDTDDMLAPVVVDLSAYANKNIQIALVHNQIVRDESGDITKIALDDISIENRPGNTDVPVLADAPTGYKLYVDNVEKIILPADSRTYKVKDLAKGTHSVAIVAVYGEEESFPLELVGINTTNPEVDFVVSDRRIGVNEEVSLTAKVKGSANSYSWSLGEGANFTNTEGAEITGTYTSTGLKTVSVTINESVINEKNNHINVVRGNANVYTLKGTELSNINNNVTLTWPSLLDKYRLYEDFESEAWPVDGWDVKKSTTLDGALTAIVEGENTWSHNDAKSFTNKGKKYIKNGKHSVAINYLATGFNWLLSPEFNVSDGDELRFWIWYNNAMTSGGEFCHTNFKIMAKERSGSEWIQILNYTEETDPNLFESEVVVNLSEYAEKNIQLAFVYEFTNGWQMAIDDVRVMTSQASATATDFSKLNIYRDEVLVHEVTDGTLTEWTDANLDTKIYKYNVTYVNASGEEGQPHKDHEVWIYKPKILPYTQNFDNEVDWIFYGSATDFKVGESADFVESGYSFPAHEGKFVAVNTSNVPAGVKKWDRVSLPPLNLGEYGSVNFSIDYVMEGTKYFEIKGREKQTSPWVTVHRFQASSDWTTTQFELPLFTLKNGYQLSLMYDNSEEASKGVAFDNIKLIATPGKHLQVEYDDKRIEIDQSQYLGIVKPGTSKDFILKVRNVGAESLEISSVDIIGTNFSLKSAPVNKTLAVQEVINLTVTYTAVKETATPEATQIVINSDAVENPRTIDVTATGGLAEWTYMVYLYEEGTGLNGFRDLNELEVNGSIPDTVNYLVLFDSEFDHEDGIYYVSRDPAGKNDKIVSKIVSDELNEGLDMNDYKTLEKFLLWGKKNYPAKKYACNLWDHGSGIFRKKEDKEWKNAVGKMPIWDLTKALKSFVDIDGQGFDIFGFDVCLLGQVETVYDLKDYTKVVIASEMNVPGNGWDYTSHFSILNENPEIDTYVFASHIVKEFGDSYNDGSQGNSKCTQVAIRTDRFESAFVPALNGFAEVAMTEMITLKDKLTLAYNGSLFADANNVREHRDLGGFLALLKAQDDLSYDVKTSIDELQAAYDDCIIEFRENKYDKATGLKIWIANDITQNSNADFYLNPEKYLTFSETKWDEFLYYYAHPTVFAEPVADFITVGEVKGRPGLVISLYDNTNCAPEAISYQWKITPATVEFLNGGTLSSKVLDVKFLEAGDYTVSLTVTNSYGSDVKNMENVIVRKASFPAPTNLSSSVDNKTVKLNWVAPVAPENIAGAMGTDKLLEGFENGWIPEGWDVKYSKTIDGELVESTKEDKSLWFKCRSNSFGTKTGNYVHSGEFSAGIGYKAPDFNWLISPEINIENHNQLKFWTWYKSDTSYHSNFRVMVKVDGIWIEKLFYTEGSAINLFEKEVAVDLSAYAGKTVQIAFVYESTDGYQMAIDDVRIVRDAPVGTPDGDIINYLIFRNGVKVSETTNLTYSENLSEYGIYSYTVTAVYENIKGSSKPSVAEQVTITKPNETPTDILLSNSTVTEDAAIATTIGTLSAVDADENDTFTFELTANGTDNALFTIEGVNLKLNTSLDYETKSSYSIAIKVSDSGNLCFEKILVISVDDIAENKAPTDILLSNSTVAEDVAIGTTIGTLSAVDADESDTFTFELTANGTDNALFAIDGINLKLNTSLDYETKSSYSITIRVSDSGNLCFEKVLVISVNDVAENKAPTDILLSNSTVAEDATIGTIIGCLSAVDADESDTFTFELTANGTDNALFAIDGINLKLNTSLDYETKSSYSITIRVSDSGNLCFEKVLVISVNDVAENKAPTDILLSNSTVAEDASIGTTIGTLSAVDMDASDVCTFELVAGEVDNNDFGIEGENLILSTELNFNSKSSYHILVKVIDESGTSFEKEFVISVMISTGIEVISETELLLYPNPVVSHLKIGCKDIKCVKVFNVIGNLVLVSVNDGNLLEVDLNFSDLKPGLYLIRIELHNNEVITKKVIK